VPTDPVNRNLVYVFDVLGGDPALLDDETTVRSTLSRIVDRAGLTPLGETSHRFTPQGFSLATLLAESHLAVHTWPEDGTAYVTLTTCRAPSSGTFEEDTRVFLREAFAADDVAVRTLL
jgi:S-adenosylmethionine decarboxylase